MTTLEDFVEQAIPHEAGHILVGRTLGIPVRALHHIVLLSAAKQLVPGNFATRGFAPADARALEGVPPQVIEAYAQMVGGGLAGNIVSGLPVTEHGLEKDRADSSVVSTDSLEQVAARSRLVIEANLDMFRKLRLAIKDRYDSFVGGPSFALGRHELLSAVELEPICPQNKTLFPPQYYL
jgi:hypothetical protein